MSRIKLKGIEAATAILFFTRTVREELSHKSLIQGQRAKDAQLFHRLITRTKRTAEATKLPLFIASSLQQRGHSFGARLTRELSLLFEQGFEKVIIIGNDCPQLSSTHLGKAASQCSARQMVLGPNSQGGAYLIAIHKTQFDPHAFRALDWERNTLLESFTKYANIFAASIEQLEMLEDLNRPEQLRLLLQLLDDHHDFKQWVLQLIKHTIPFFFYFLDLISNTNAHRLHGSRAP